MELLKLPDRCPACDQPYADGSTYCTVCKKDLSEIERNYCLDPKCENHTAYLPVGLKDCPACGKPTSNAEQINEII